MPGRLRRDVTMETCGGAQAEQIFNDRFEIDGVCQSAKQQHDGPVQ
jgi:hypothetical protein